MKKINLLIKNLFFNKIVNQYSFRMSYVTIINLKKLSLICNFL